MLGFALAARNLRPEQAQPGCCPATVRNGWRIACLARAILTMFSPELYEMVSRMPSDTEGHFTISVAISADSAQAGARAFACVRFQASHTSKFAIDNSELWCSVAFSFGYSQCTWRAQLDRRLGKRGRASGATLDLDLVRTSRASASLTPPSR